MSIVLLVFILLFYAILTSLVIMSIADEFEKTRKHRCKKKMVDKIRKKTQKGVSDSFKNEIKDILDRIKLQASQGKNSYGFIRLEIEKEIIEYFKQEGFEVEVRKEDGGIYPLHYSIIIRW